MSTRSKVRAGISRNTARSITRLRRLGTVGGPLSGIGPVGWTLFGLVALIVGATVALVNAPATWLDFVIRQNTQGRVRLADAGGTIWNGSGNVVLVDINADAASSGAPAQPAVKPGLARPLAGVTVPGRLNWNIDPAPLLIGRVQALLRHDSMKEAVLVQGGFSQWSVAQGAMQLSTVDLSPLGSLWNTLQPTGSLSISWQPLRIEDGSLVGRIVLELRDIASALTPVRPLGALRMDVDASANTAQLRMQPLQGPLRLSGSGQWTQRGGLRFMADARVDEAERLRLQSLLSIIGRREGDRTVIKIGA